MELLKKIFLDTQLLGIIIGFIATYIIYRLSRRDASFLQKNIWKKEFDRYQTEPLVEVFKNILIILDNNTTAATVKSSIPKRIINKLKIEIQFIRYLNEETRKKIQEHIYKKCLDYNDIIHKRLSTPEESGTERESSDMVENENRREREKREEIEKAIIEVIDEIKSIYSEF